MKAADLCCKKLEEMADIELGEGILNLSRAATILRREHGRNICRMPCNTRSLGTEQAFWRNETPVQWRARSLPSVSFSSVEHTSILNRNVFGNDSCGARIV
jgi:hypothetical protein